MSYIKDRYKFGEWIGKGAYGVVHKAFDRELGLDVAIKIINLEDFGDEIENLSSEIVLMSHHQEVSHENNLVRYYASHVVDSDLWIIMEYLDGGSLADILELREHLDELSIKYVLHRLLIAISHMHNDRKLHRDVKAGNILVNSEGVVKLADFGANGQLSDSLSKRKTRVGTPFWMAPEVIRESAYDGCADIWSVGITAIELATGSPPLAREMHPMQAILLIPEREAPHLDDLEGFSDACKAFVRRCLRKNPEERPTARELLADPFMADVTDTMPATLIDTILMVPEQRRQGKLRQKDGHSSGSGHHLPSSASHSQSGTSSGGGSQKGTPTAVRRERRRRKGGGRGGRDRALGGAGTAEEGEAGEDEGLDEWTAEGMKSSGGGYGGRETFFDWAFDSTEDATDVMSDYLSGQDGARLGLVGLSAIDLRRNHSRSRSEHSDTESDSDFDSDSDSDSVDTSSLGGRDSNVSSISRGVYAASRGLRGNSADELVQQGDSAHPLPESSVFRNVMRPSLDALKDSVRLLDDARRYSGTGSSSGGLFRLFEALEGTLMEMDARSNGALTTEFVSTLAGFMMEETGIS